MASRGFRKTYFFSHLKACERRNFDFCVFLRVDSLPFKNSLCGPAWHVRSVHSPYINRFLKGRLLTRKNTQKSNFLLSQAFKWKKKIMFFVIPEMPSKTFVMLYKTFSLSRTYTPLLLAYSACKSRENGISHIRPKSDIRSIPTIIQSGKHIFRNALKTILSLFSGPYL